MTLKNGHKLRISFNSPVVLGFAAICLISQLLKLVLTDRTYQYIFSVYRARFDAMTVVRLFTHVFGHSGWEHFLGNMMYFLILGPMLEEKYGSKRLIIIIAIVAAVTGLFNIIIFSNTAVLGASGVVFAFILLSSITRRDTGAIPLTFILVAVLYIGQQLLQIFKNDEISQLSHIVGGAVGTVIGFILNARPAGAGRLSK
ncbi:MAG: rhomboid family intramembrane serine protease [Clostridia bacterium]|nr:rhomboid family intramembrane serine protease [Clostridia bacterium]